MGMPASDQEELLYDGVHIFHGLGKPSVFFPDKKSSLSPEISRISGLGRNGVSEIVAGCPQWKQ